MKRMIFICLISILAPSLINAQEIRPVTENDIKTWCYYLAGDEMMGRKNGSPQMKIAANYVAAVFRDAGLKPLSDESGYFQEYNITGRNGQTITERNVIGMLPGSDPALKDEWIVLSAHFDHIGTGKAVNGDSIFNGADDNATGTVTVMALARNLAGSSARPGRSILFVAYSGEEMGLRGSRHFVANCPIPVDRIKLNLNFEMEGESATLGRNRYILTGHQYTDFDELLDRYNRDKEWQVARKYKSPEWIFLGSDNAALAVRREAERSVLNIPAFTLVTTDDMNFIHKVTDEPQRMDYENMASLVKYTTGLVLYLSADPLVIRWDQEAFDKTMER